MVKRLLKSFTFWFIVAGIGLVLYNLSGHDDKSIIMIGLNPLLSILSHSDYCLTIAEIPYLWHLLSFLTMTLYGIFFDLLACIIRSKSRNRIRGTGCGLLLLTVLLSIVIGRFGFALYVILSILGVALLLLGAFQKNAS